MSTAERVNRGCVVRRQKPVGSTETPICSIGVEDLPLPSPRADEVVVEIKVVGICGSDVHYWQDGAIGDFVVGEKLTLGHEAAGVVVQLGEDVTTVQVGDRVAVEPGVSCRHCHFCRTGRYNLCKDMKFWATPPIDGSLCNFVAIQAANCFKIPDSMSFEAGAMIEPFSVGLYACQRAGVTVGTRVLILGAGPIGLMCVLAAKAFGAKMITIMDMEEGRLGVARECGATWTGVVDATTPLQLGPLLPEAPDVVMECTGAEPAVSTALNTVAVGGKVVCIGCGPPRMTVPLILTTAKELDVLGQFRYRNTWPLGIHMAASGQVDFRPLITHRYAFDTPGDVVQAFECTHRRRDESGRFSLKVVISLDPTSKP